MVTDQNRDGDETECANRVLTDTGQTTSRRSWLRGIAATASVGALFGFGSTAAAGSTADQLDRYFEEFGTVIDVVEAGADNTGTESVVDVIREYRGDDTLLVFPPGEYYMDEQVRFTGFEKFGLAGNDATLVPADYHTFDGPQYRLFRLGVDYNPGTRLVFNGFDIDQTAPDTGIRVIDAVVTDGLEVRDISVQGHHDSGTWGPGRFTITDPSGTGLVENFAAPDGGAWVDETPNDGNLWRGPTGLLANSNKGTLRFVDCVLGGFPDNGLYASGGSGKIVVDGGVFKNSNAACVRVGGQGSVVRNATIEVDQNRPQDSSHRGLRLEQGDDLRVENVTIRNTEPLPNSYGISVLNSCESVWIEDVRVNIAGDEVDHGVVISPEAGDVVLLDSDIELNTPGGDGIQIHGEEGAGEVILEYLNIVGDAGTEAGFNAGIRSDRDNVRFGKVAIDQPGGTKRNAVINTGDNVKIYDGFYRASQYPIVDLGTGTWVEEIYAKSHSDTEAICLYDESADVYLKNNRLRGGIKDYGCDGLKSVGNGY